MTEQQQPGPDLEADAPEQHRPAADSSVLTSLRDRRQAALAEAHLDLAVPRLDPPVYVRFKPIDDSRFNALMKRFEKYKGNDRNVVHNASILAECCLGVFEVIDGEKVSIDPADRDGDWPRFDPQLAQLLGQDLEPRAADVVRGLYVTDGDVIATAGKLAEWSGYSLADLEELTAGN